MLSSKYKFHIFSLFIISSYYIFSYLLFDTIIINSHDNLESRVVTDHIISKIYNGETDAYKTFLGGDFKWYNLYRIFFPENLLFLFFDTKQLYFFYEGLEKLISYFSFYLLAKFLFKNKINSIFGALFYTVLVNDISNPPATLFLCFLPYIFYILINKTSLEFKYCIIFFLVGLNSSLIFDYPPLCFIFLFSLFFSEKKNSKTQFQFFLIATIGMIISAIPMFITLFAETIHRIERVNQTFWRNIITEYEYFFKILNPFSIYFYKFPITILNLFILLLALFTRNKKIKITLLFIFLCYFLKILLSSNFLKIFLDYFNLSLLDSINFARISISLKLLFSILFAGILNLYLKQRAILSFLLIFSSLSYQIYFPSLEFFKEFVQKNLKDESIYLIKKEYNDNKINFKKIISTVTNKNNYKEKNISFNLSTKNSFDGFFRFELYKKIKSKVGLDRVGSIGINPMIAAMNNINIIDGYHEIYSLNYKYKFRKIIADELEKNEKLRNYYDNWGNRVYLFYSDKENLLINFKEAKKLGAKYIISYFSINHKDLNFENLYSDDDNNIYLYKIN